MCFVLARAGLTCENRRILHSVSDREVQINPSRDDQLGFVHPEVLKAHNSYVHDNKPKQMKKEQLENNAQYKCDLCEFGWK